MQLNPMIETGLNDRMSVTVEHGRAEVEEGMCPGVRFEAVKFF